MPKLITKFMITFMSVFTALLMRTKRRAHSANCITSKQLVKMLAAHNKWIAHGCPWPEKSNMRQLDLRGMDLQCVNLRDQNLQRALLCGADLRGANLYNADLREADLCNANLQGANISFAILTDARLHGASLQVSDMRNTHADGRYIKNLNVHNYPVTYTLTHMQIGCQLHPLADWWAFTAGEIEDMSTGTPPLPEWRLWKPILRKIVTESPARGY